MAHNATLRAPNRVGVRQVPCVGEPAAQVVVCATSGDVIDHHGSCSPSVVASRHSSVGVCTEASQHTRRRSFTHLIQHARPSPL